MEKTSVVILPYPLTPAALIGYGILRFLGQISENAHVRFTPMTRNSPPALFNCEKRICDLRIRPDLLASQVCTIVNQSPLLMRAMNFSVSGGKLGQHRKLTSALKQLSIEASNFALSVTQQEIEFILANKIDIWKSDEFVANTIRSLQYSQAPTTTTSLIDEFNHELPVFKEKFGGMKTPSEIVDKFNVTLNRGRILSLPQKKISIAVGGPSGSGKSTFVASLVDEIEKVIQSLQGRFGFSSFHLKIASANLDLGTPTVESISAGLGCDRDFLTGLKQEWTMDLAETGLEKYRPLKVANNITICDFPGKMTDITRFLLSSMDACILLSRDWEVLNKEWAPEARKLGIPILSKVRSRMAKDGLPSMVTTYAPGEMISGRVVELDRILKEEDPFISSLALFLLFDILPTIFGEETKTIKQ